MTPNTYPLNENIDLVVGLPKEHWKTEYERAEHGIFDRGLSHVDDVHTGKRFFGLGVVVKTPDGNAVEAQVQLAVWMAGLISWCVSSREHPRFYPPPAIGCTVVGGNWEFYVAYGIPEPCGQLSEVVCLATRSFAEFFYFSRAN